MAVATPADYYLDHSYGLILQALAYRGTASSEAYRQWRGLCSLSDAPFAQHQAFPWLAEVAIREGVHEDDLKRLQGVGRSLWSRNTAVTRSVLLVLDILGSNSIVPILPSVLGLLARQDVQLAEVALGSIELVVRSEEHPAAQRLLETHSYVRVAGLTDAIGSTWRSPHDQNTVSLRISPLANVTNRHFVQRVFASAVHAKFNGRRVQVMSPTYQLFCAMVHSGSLDEISRFARILEGFRVLNGQAGVTVDWPVVAQESERFGLSDTPLAYLTFLAHNTPFNPPAAMLEALARSSHTSGGRDGSLGWEPNARGKASGKIKSAIEDVRYSRHSPEVLLRKAAWAARRGAARFIPRREG
ncbi:hypothetical protein [Devosia sp. MC1541]|uniref:hypothetical protein n=1 Tax=Devosia sp. MC1541 TaxID=2725264 RepID=UPI00145F5908|nr:hypothetical protein [Devosia sp. MC1541]